MKINFKTFQNFLKVLKLFYLSKNFPKNILTNLYGPSCLPPNENLATVLRFTHSFLLFPCVCYCLGNRVSSDVARFPQCSRVSAHSRASCTYIAQCPWLPCSRAPLVRTCTLCVQTRWPALVVASLVELRFSFLFPRANCLNTPFMCVLPTVRSLSRCPNHERTVRKKTWGAQWKIKN